MSGLLSAAQTFFYNSASRLHPTEWTTGVAAGAAAVLMVRHGCGTAALLAGRVGELRALLNSSVVGQPLEWTG